ncbi:MAG: TAXI family TRAP transporter solute-binding subunit [Chloroflexota bacterium]
MWSHKALNAQAGVVLATIIAVLLAACGPKEAPGAKPATSSGQPAAVSSGPTLAPVAKSESVKPDTSAAPAAKNYKLPDVINWVTLDVGSATYNVHQAIAHGTSGREKNTIRLIPTGTDLGRLAIYKDGRADFGNDPGIYASEGITFYSDKEAGPTDVRLIAINWPKTNQLVGCAGDLGIKEPKDLKGRRMVYVSNSFGFNLNMEATLAAGNLTWEDVKRVDIPSYGGAGRAIMEDKADCVWTATNTGFVYEMANSPRGYSPVYMKTQQEDPEMWSRFLKVNPAGTPGKATVGAPPISEENPHYGNGPHFGTISTLSSKDAEYVYAMTKAIYEAFPEFNGSYPGVEGLASDRVRFDQIFSPVHDGSIRYFKEKGWWTDAAEKRQQELLKREPVLKAAWEKSLADPQGKSLQGDDWARFWAKQRADGLKAAGLDPYWEDAFWLRLL